MRTWLAFVTALLATSFAVAAESPVTVHVTPPSIVRRTFDPARPPPEMPKLTPPEVGQCVYEFGCEMETSAIHPGISRGKVRARIASVTFTTRLSVTLWTPRQGPEGILAHEEGHRQISEHYYRPSRDIARQLGHRLVGTTIEISGGQDALQAKLSEVQSRTIKAYLAETLTRCSDAQQRFDAITEHSRNTVPVREAIVRAIAEEERFYATRSSAPTRSPATPPAANPKRSHPTRPRT